MSVNHLIRDLAERLEITSIVVTHLVSCVLFAAGLLVAGAFAGDEGAVGLGGC